MPPKLERIGQLAQTDSKLRFTALAHHIDEEFLRETWRGLNRRGAAGVDGVSMSDYETKLDENLKNLMQRLRAHSYRAPNVRRTYIPKAGNPAKLRPLGIPTVEDRLLQAAVARLLMPIYEADFLDCSYGFRPGRTAHQALAEVNAAVLRGEAQWVVEADIKGFFDHLVHEWLRRMLKLRIGDPWILRLIGKWLRAGILDQGKVTTPAEGTPQGGPLSPLLANIYLHYVLDLWFTRVVCPRCRGAAKIIRFADDYVALFELEWDAQRFADVLPKRMAKFGLSLAEEKTKLIPFGRRHWVPGKSHEHYFDLLGFRHHLGTNRKGRLAVVRIPCPKSVRKFLGGVQQWLVHHRHDRPSDQQRALAQKLRGFYQYFALWHTLPKLRVVRNEVQRLWYAALRRRGQRGRLVWEEWRRKPWFDLPQPKLMHRMV